jgi:hypothetical protein
MSLMRDPNERNEAYTAAHAIAGFQLAEIGVIENRPGANLEAKRLRGVEVDHK